MEQHGFQWPTINRNVSYMSNESLDESNTHTDVVSSHRLQGFSDAVFATAATLLVIPIRKFHKGDKQTLKEALLAHWLEFLVFILGYLVICSVWESQIIRMKLLKKVDDVIVVLTLISLMVTTFLPFTIELEGKFANKESPIVINAILLIVLELLELAMFIYGFHTPKLLTEHFNELPDDIKSIKKKQIYMKISLNCSLFLCASFFCSVSYIASSVIVCIVIITPLLRRIMVRFSNYCSCCFGVSTTNEFQVLTGRMDKERVEMFSDAAMAIIATLLILDLTTEEFPDKSLVEKLGLINTLRGMWQDFVAYIGTFIVVGMQWFVHHSVIQKIQIFTPLMVLLNNLFLAFAAFSPFISTLNNKYTGHITHDEEVAVRISSLCILLSSTMVFLIYVCALSQQNVAFYDWAIAESHRPGNKSRIYLFLKTLIIPVTALFVFTCAFISRYATYIVYHLALVIVPFLFILLKSVFACHCLQEQSSDDPNLLDNDT